MFNKWGPERKDHRKSIVYEEISGRAGAIEVAEGIVEARVVEVVVSKKVGIVVAQNNSLAPVDDIEEGEWSTVSQGRVGEGVAQIK